MLKVEDKGVACEITAHAGGVASQLKRKREDAEIIESEKRSDEGEGRGVAMDDDIEDFGECDVDVPEYLGAVGDAEEANDVDEYEDVPVLQWRMAWMGMQVMQLRGIAV